MKFKLNYLKIALYLGASVALSISHAGTLQTLTDEQLSESTGQALMSLSYLAPTDSTNPMKNIVTDGKSNTVGFYKLGLEADLEINANIKKLQLGCGGVNGAGACDIDIDNFSLSGNATTREGRVSSDAVLSNPFIEFAIKNPDSASTRSIEGFRISAEKAFGMLTFGSENSSTANGINSFSGYMKLASASGNATTEARTMTQALGPMTGRIKIENAWPLDSDPSDFKADTYSLNLQSTGVPFATRTQEVYGNRMTSVNLTADAVIPIINFSGPLAASLKIAGIPITLNKNVTGKIANLGVKIDIDQSLGMIHSIPVNGNPFSLSLQSNDIHWTGASVAASKGWWMAFENEINLGSVTPADNVKITDDLLKQVLPKVNQYLYDVPITCNGIGGCLSGELPIANPVDLNGQIVNLPLSNLKLSAQDFAPNCYGSLKFC